MKQKDPGLETITRFIDRYHSFAVVGHEEPDGDCLCSQISLESVLERIGKRVCLASPGPFVRPEIAHLDSRFARSLSACSEPPDAVIVVDCSTLGRIGDIANEVTDLPVAVIDHHTAGESFGTVRYIDPTAPSVTFIIHQLMKLLSLEPTAEEADQLLFGLCTDTGYFRHLGENTARVFLTVAELVAAGASPKSIYYRMFGNRSFASRKLLGRLLARSEELFEGRVLLTWEGYDDLMEFGADHRDSDTVYRELLAVSGCKAVILVRAETKETSSIGLRSLDDIDVGELARRMGGGGHRNASGCSVDLPVEAARRKIVETFVEMFEIDSP